VSGMVLDVGRGDVVTALDCVADPNHAHASVSSRGKTKNKVEAGILNLLDLLHFT
jgi:hypothetical protein